MSKLFKTAFNILSVGIILIIFGCRKDVAITDNSAKITLSTDTIVFDTVFTSIGSTTRILKIVNSYNQKIVISSIKLGGGLNSQFRINVDGIPCVEIHNVEIPAKDSIYVFVKVTVNPNNINSPLVINDSILFETNGNPQQVNLVAWGQDAYYYYPNPGSFYSIIPCNSTWTNDKPHVIYGYAVVDSACTLNIEAGTRVHLHNNAVLWVYKDGTLHVNGTLINPVTFQGDRLEQDYKELPGQWGEIWLSAGSIDNTINYAIIKNGIIGLQVDTFAGSNPTLTMTNTIIENMTDVGIYGRGSKIVADNCVIGNCGVYAVALTIGGSYNFRHCTIGNYWNYNTRQTSSLLLNNYYKDVNDYIQIRPLVKATFENSIIYGNLENEITLDTTIYGGLFNYYFDHCLLQTGLSMTNPSHFSVCVKSAINPFADPTNNDYTHSAGSAAVDAGSSIITNTPPALMFDILGHSRNLGTAPDIGAYERVP